MSSVAVAIECSQDTRSAAVTLAGTVVAIKSELGFRQHGERLGSLVEEARLEAGVSWSQVDHLFVGVGPGSFTGIRVAVAATRAFALTIDRPVHAVTTFEALAAFQEGPSLCLVDARRDRFYGQEMDDHGLSVGAARIATVEQWLSQHRGPDQVLAADPMERLDDRFCRRIELDASLVAAAALRGIDRGSAAIAGSAVQPYYLRAPDATPMAV
ncbi:MAG: tRNA (adenosine(37)-N6)-threonylcarbamoyltransferase complex dimerization subunit type 1 TsaB [Geminicoccaceae bacterium]